MLGFLTEYTLESSHSEHMENIGYSIVVPVQPPEVAPVYVCTFNFSKLARAMP